MTTNFMLANYYVQNNSTVRETADHFDIPKSTVHERLKIFSLSKFDDKELATLAFKVGIRLKINKAASLTKATEAIAKKYLSQTTEERHMQEVRIENQKETFPTAQEFYEATIENQRKVLKELIEKAMLHPSPVIRLPFDTYPEIEAEMEQLGLDYDYYEDESGKRCAEFAPDQYLYPADE